MDSPGAFPFSDLNIGKRLNLVDLQRSHLCGYAITSEIEGDSSSHIANFIAEEENAYLQKVTAEKRRSDFVRGRKAAKLAISMVSGCDPLEVSIVDGCFRQPIVKSNGEFLPIQVSLSHTEGVAVAIAFPMDLLVGIDIEQIKPRGIEKFSEYVSNQEIGLYRSLNFDEQTSFVVAWTVKEALLKAFKTGLGSDIEFAGIKSVMANQGSVSSEFRHHHVFKAVSWVSGDHVLSLVVPKSVIAFDCESRAK